MIAAFKSIIEETDGCCLCKSFKERLMAAVSVRVS